MKLFLWRVFLFCIPLIVLGVAEECLLRRIPNDYQYKKAFLDAHADSLEVLFLGSSHAFYGINPDHIQSKSYNAAYVSQSLKYDKEIYDYYSDKLTNLRVIAIPVSYFSLNTTLEGGPEHWRVKNYSIYYGLSTSYNITDHSEFLGNKTNVGLQKLYNHYYLNTSNISCTAGGWGFDHPNTYTCNLVKEGQEAARRHTRRDESAFESNLDCLHEVIRLAEQKHIQVLLYTPPAYNTYVEHLEPGQLEQMLTTAGALDTQYGNATYINFLKDTSFTAQDFYDADHLNARGAEKFSGLMGKAIAQLYKH